MVNVFHRQIGGFVSAKSRGENFSKKMFRREMEHFHFGNIQVFENVRDGDELKAMTFERAALRADGVLSDASESAQVHERAFVAAHGTFKTLFRAVQKFEERRRHPEFIFYFLDKVDHIFTATKF